MSTSTRHKTGIGIIGTLWLAVVGWLILEALTLAGVIAL